MDFSKILAALHVQNTTMAKQGSMHWKHKVPIENVSKALISALTKEEHQKIIGECYGIFKAKNLPFGTIHNCADVFYEIFMEYLMDGLERSAPSIEVPNGCCSKDDCPINVWYDLILERLLLRQDINEDKHNVEQSFLAPGHHVGISTVGGVLKVMGEDGVYREP